MIPRTHEQWIAVTPNDTDVALSDRFREEQPYIPPPHRLFVLAAASRLNEQERCVAALAKSLYAQFEDQRRSLHPSEVPDMDWCVDEARRILGCEPESPDAYFRADYASNRREARRGLVGEPESGEKGDAE